MRDKPQYIHGAGWVEEEFDDNGRSIGFVRSARPREKRERIFVTCECGRSTVMHWPPYEGAWFCPMCHRENKA